MAENSENETKEVFKKIDNACYQENQRQQNVRQLRSKVAKLQKQVSTQRESMKQFQTNKETLRLLIQKEKTRCELVKDVEENENCSEKIEFCLKIAEKNVEIAENFKIQENQTSQNLSPTLKSFDAIYEKLLKAKNVIEIEFQSEIEKYVKIIENLSKIRSNKAIFHENELEKEKSALNLAEAELKMLMSENERKKKFLDFKESETDISEKKLERSNEKISEYRSKFVDISSEIVDKKEFLNELSSKLDVLNEKLDALTQNGFEKNAKFQSDSENHTEILKEKRKKVEYSEEIFQNLNRKVAEQKKRSESLKTTLIRKEDEIEEMKKVYALTHSETDELNMSIRNFVNDHFEEISVSIELD